MIAQKIRNLLSFEIGQLNRNCQNMPSQVYDCHVKKCLFEETLLK